MTYSGNFPDIRFGEPRSAKSEQTPKDFGPSKLKRQASFPLVLSAGLAILGVPAGIYAHRICTEPYKSAAKDPAGFICNPNNDGWTAIKQQAWNSLGNDQKEQLVFQCLTRLPDGQFLYEDKYILLGRTGGLRELRCSTLGEITRIFVDSDTAQKALRDGALFSFEFTDNPEAPVIYKLKK